MRHGVWQIVGCGAGCPAAGGRGHNEDRTAWRSRFQDDASTTRREHYSTAGRELLVMQQLSSLFLPSLPFPLRSSLHSAGRHGGDVTTISSLGISAPSSPSRVAMPGSRETLPLKLPPTHST